MAVKTRLGIDLGTNSIGWCLLELDNQNEPCGLIDMGARVFPDGRDPKSKASLAVDRRMARGMRRRRDRFLRRQKKLMTALIESGLMPKDITARKALETEDPYTLRANALNNPLPIEHVGRALFHLHQRRGFKSNRKTDKSSGKEGQKIKQAVSALRDRMEETGARTVGEFLARRHKNGKSVRARLHGKGKNAAYDLYIDRAMIAEEFEKIWQAQAPHHSEMTGAAKNKIHKIMFRQRDLEKKIPGKCALSPSTESFPNDPDGYRAPLALPAVQRFRIRQELANCHIIFADRSSRRLTKRQTDKIAETLYRGKSRTFRQMRKDLGLDSTMRFSLESEKRDRLDEDKTAKLLSKDTCFGEQWNRFDLSRQMEIAGKLLHEEDESELIAWLCNNFDLDEERVENIANAPLADGYGQLGLRALMPILEAMETETAIDPDTGEILEWAMHYDQAALRAGFDHSQREAAELRDRLPYYGEVLQRHICGDGDPDHDDEIRYGRFPNPTVHIALNQLKRLTNALIRHHGKPDQIVIEVTRELKQSVAKKDEIKKRQAENQKQNERFAEDLAKEDLPATPDNLRRMRLWAELGSDPMNRACVYTGEIISLSRLFSAEVEIEHILPFSKTLDNSAANKTVSMRYANRAKTDTSPFDAFGNTPQWPAILARSEQMPDNKKWRFSPDAMDRFENEERDFLDRQLHDTAYLSRLSGEYLTAICPANNIWVTPGRLTSMLRGKWGLNRQLHDDGAKNRNDHRHHAIDGFVIAMTDRSLLNKVSQASARLELEGAERVIADLPEPWPTFRQDLKDRLASLIVSHKPDHGVQGQLHNDTAYGIIGEYEDKGTNEVVHRVAVADLKLWKQINGIRDLTLQSRLGAALEGLDPKQQKKEWQDALSHFAEKHQIRRVRIVEKLSVIPIRDENGNIYKSYKGDSNAYMDITIDDKGIWIGNIVSTFEANRQKKLPKLTPNSFRLFINDKIWIPNELGKGGQVMVISQLSDNRIVLTPHNEAGSLRDRDQDETDSFKYLRKTPNSLGKTGAKPVYIDEIGRVHDARAAA